MNSPQRSKSSHVFAALGSITILTTLPLLLYFLLLVVTNDVGGPLNLILIPCSNLITAFLFTFVICFPLSRLLDRFFQREGQNQDKKISPFLLSGGIWVLILVLIVGGFILMLGRILGASDPDSVIVGLFRFLLLGGIPLLLGGATYWFLLEAMRKMLSNREDSEYPKAG